MQHCINITDDKKLEEDEYFILELNRSSSNVIFKEPVEANVTIKDDECKCLS